MPVTHEKTPWPPWLRDLAYFASILVALVVFGLSQKSDIRSVREGQERQAQDMSNLARDIGAIRQSLPDPEVLDMRFKAVEKDLAALVQTVETEKLRTQQLRERLIKKGWIE